MCQRCVKGTTAIGPRGNSFQQYKKIHFFCGISRTRISQRGLLLCHISVKGDVPSDDFLSVAGLYFLTLLCCSPFRPIPAKPIELQKLFPLRRLDFTCSINYLASYHVRLQPRYVNKCMHTKNLCNYTSTCFSPN